jgi:fatty acid desaturase
MTGREAEDFASPAKPGFEEKDMGRTARIIVAAVIGLLLAGALVAAFLHVLKWPFVGLLVTFGTLTITKLLEFPSPAPADDRADES